MGKKSKDAPLIANEYGKTIYETNNIYINESLTFLRNKQTSWQGKFVWTLNGKILLRESEHSKVFEFTNINHFDSFIGQPAE